jgi:hypothetical protein
MNNDLHTAYLKAFNALRDKDYSGALDCLETAEKEFAGNPDFRILAEACRLILAVKSEIKSAEKELV